MQGVKAESRQHHGPGCGEEQSQPHSPCHQTHLADARVGQHRFGLRLGQSQGHPAESRDKSGDQADQPPGGECPLPQREETQPGQQTRFDHGPRQHGAGRGGRGRVGQGQPEVQREATGLDAETNQDKAENQVTMGRNGNPRREFGQTHCAFGGDQHETGDQQHLSQYRHDQIDLAGLPGLRISLMNDQAVSGEGHEGEKQIEASHVPGHDQPQIAGHGQQKKEEEGLEARLIGQIAAGIQGRGPPNQRGKKQKDAARQVQAKGAAEKQPGVVPGLRRPQGQRDRRQGRPGGGRHRPGPPPATQAASRQQQGKSQDG